MTRGLRAALLGLTVLVLVVVYTPLLLVLVNSFNVDRTFTWPPPDLTTKWWDLALHSKGARSALWTSVQVALAATAFALVLGTLAGLALRQTRFFGRNVVSLVIILPIALPGIVTGIALSNAFTTVLGVGLSLFTIVVAHATFCIVTVFNNVQARLSRLAASPQNQPLPIWIFQNLFRPNQAPVVNVVAAVLVILSAVPIYLAQRLSGSTEGMTGAR